LSKPGFASLAVLPCLAGAATLVAPLAANAAGITVTSAKVASGKLTVTGTTPAANQQLKLDGTFTTTSNASKVYTFTIATYLPADCIVDLALVSGTATGTAPVANCAPQSIYLRGPWSSANHYVVNDVAVFQGSAWQAKTANVNQQPNTHPLAWRKFLAQAGIGATGPQGLAGPQGPQGLVGDIGPTSTTPGLKGDTGSTGPKGDPGPSGIVSTAAINWWAFGDGVPDGGNPGQYRMMADANDYAAGVVVAAGQRLTVSFSVPIASAAAPAAIRLQPCYRNAGSILNDNATLFSVTNQQDNDVYSVLHTFGTAGSITPPAGTYDVGLCVFYSDAMALSFDFVTGYVQVTP
jgi:hypothetical protein